MPGSVSLNVTSVPCSQHILDSDLYSVIAMQASTGLAKARPEQRTIRMFSLSSKIETVHQWQFQYTEKITLPIFGLETLTLFMVEIYMV